MVLDMKALMADEVARGKIEEIQKVLENDAVIGKMMEAAEGLKDAYEIVKKFISVKYETFKALCMDAMEYFNEDKVALSDETMDAVVGGGFFGDLWNKCKKTVISVGVGVLWGVAAAGIAFAFAGVVVGTGGVGTIAVSAAIGALVGTGAGLTYYFFKEIRIFYFL